MYACARTRNCNGRGDDLCIVVVTATTTLSIAKLEPNFDHTCAVPLRPSLAQNRR
jgi:hypothetical protein